MSARDGRSCSGEWTGRASYAEAELLLSGGYTASLDLVRQFACLTEVFLAAQLTFLTASREIFYSLSEVQREQLVALGRATEAELWRDIGAFVRRDRQDIARRGVLVSEEPPADLVRALRTAAEPDVRRFVASLGADGATLLGDYRRVIGF
jgi:TRAP-type C4-dicarboxylate transport system substrate-binding protein